MTNSVILQLTKGAMVANVPFDPEVDLALKSKFWTQIFPLRDPAKGQIGFVFDRVDNHLVGLQLYYAKYCLPEHLIDGRQYITDTAPVEIPIFVDTGFPLLHLKIAKPGLPLHFSQSIELAAPADGSKAVLDVDVENRLVGIELIWFKSRFHPV